jgi:eukaryotic-like serine/threonine-protein kinase
VNAIEPGLDDVGPGTVLDGRYRLDALLAQGGFGTVYRATHLESGCEVAVKLLHARHANHAPTVQRFYREADLLAQLRHPNTVMTYELGISGSTMFIAMELLRGESLCGRIARVGVISWLHAVRIAQDICAALWEAHERGIVHRDLKPGNVHLEAQGGGEQVKVLDFGVAKLVRGRAKTHPDLDGELTMIGQIIGTPEYMAPEQLVGETVDHRADIYALGATLYEMLTGKRVFEIFGDVDVMLSLIARHDAPKPSALVKYAPKSIAAALDGTVMRCLAPEPRDRFASVAELAEALEQVVLAAQPWRTDSAARLAMDGGRRRFARGSYARFEAQHVEHGQEAPAEEDRTGRIDIRRVRA